jgi:hypothetical protein
LGKMTKLSECLLCKINSGDMRKLACNENVCTVCLERMIESNVKRFNCTKCTKFHLVNTRYTFLNRMKKTDIQKQSGATIMTRSTANAIKTMTTEDVEAVAIVKDINGNTSKATREPFRYDNCMDPITKKLMFNNRINLAYLNTLNPGDFLLRPISHNQILLYNNETFFVVSQNGEIQAKHEAKGFGHCVEIRLNKNFIYAVYESSRYKCMLIQFDYEFQLVKRLYLNMSYYSITCSDTHIYVSGLFF